MDFPVNCLWGSIDARIEGCGKKNVEGRKGGTVK